MYASKSGTSAGREYPRRANTLSLATPTALKTESTPTLELPSCGRLRRAPAAWNLGHAARRASYVLHRTRPAAHCRNVAVALPAVLSYPWACRSACDCIPSFDCSSWSLRLPCAPGLSPSFTRADLGPGALQLRAPGGAFLSSLFARLGDLRACYRMKCAKHRAPSTEH